MEFYNDYRIDVVDFARQIIRMDNKIQQLEHDLEHKEKLLEIYQKGSEESLKNSQESIGIILSAVLDPESNINKADRIIAENELKKH
jgi:CO dehydrogenase nickel-insertion accessory protein CooC1